MHTLAFRALSIVLIIFCHSSFGEIVPVGERFATVGIHPQLNGKEYVYFTACPTPMPQDCSNYPEVWRVKAGGVPERMVAAPEFRYTAGVFKSPNPSSTEGIIFSAYKGSSPTPATFYLDGKVIEQIADYAVIDPMRRPVASSVISGERLFVGFTRSLWVTDGTAQGSKWVKTFDYGVEFLTGLGSKGVLFSAGSFATGLEPWQSDGTATGTAMISDIVPANYGSDPRDFVVAGSKIYFIAREPSAVRFRIFESDGTSGGTRILSNDITDPKRIVALGDVVIFSGKVRGSPGTFAYRVGSATTFERLADGEISSARDSAMTLGSRLLARVTDVKGVELLITDGTKAGSAVLDLKPGTGSSNPGHFTACGEGKVAFLADGGVWITGGSHLNTRKFTLPAGVDLRTILGSVSNQGFFASSNQVYSLDCLNPGFQPAGYDLIGEDQGTTPPETILRGRIRRTN